MNIPHLFEHGRTFWVRVTVPPLVRASLGGRSQLKASLRTQDLREAVKRREPTVKALKDAIEAARRGRLELAERLISAAAHGIDPVAAQRSEEDALVAEALEWRAEMAKGDDSEGWDDALSVRIDEELGPEIGEDEDGAPIYDRERERRAGLLASVARGRSTPLGPLVDEWLSLSAVEERTKAKRRQSLREFLEWLSTQGLSPTLESVTGRIVARYVNEALVPRGLDPETINAKVSAGSTFWKWLIRMEHTEANPWAGKGVAKRAAHRTGGEEDARPWTDEEVTEVMRLVPGPLLRDMALVAALSGMRLGEIATLRVKDVADGVFTLRKAKTRAGVRRVPIHSGLSEVIERRTRGKASNEPLFEDIPNKRKKYEERGAAVSTLFGRFIRQVGLAEIPEGKKRSRVTFHSFRAWFITKAEQADQPPHIIQAVSGHKRAGETLGRYSAGPSLNGQMRACVEAVKLPASTRLRGGVRPVPRTTAVRP